MKRTLALLFITLHLGGCASLRGEFENRLACSANSDQAYLVSMYGPVGLATKVSSSDIPELCKKVIK
jgi:hypothetical protein